MIKVAPSILSADFSRLKEELAAVKQAGADLIHVDVMDGHFVPNITIGPVVVKDMRKSTDQILDVHLMIENPAKYVDRFVEAGSDWITFHIETISGLKLKQQAMKLKRKKIRVGISLNPNTPLAKIKPVLRFVDFVLVMSVFPGFGGQEFIASSVTKVRQLRQIYKGDISIDGGINNLNAKQVVGAGANILVAGSYVFKSKNYKEAIESLKCAI